jgi:hypothetical protein
LADLWYALLATAALIAVKEQFALTQFLRDAAFGQGRECKVAMHRKCRLIRM